MRKLTLLGAVAALFLGAVAFYGSQAVAGEYDDCFGSTPVCTGSCQLGTCTPIVTSLAALDCRSGNPDGYRGSGSCGSCTLLGVVPSGDSCGQALAAEVC